jgi:hypothetical protein
MLGWVEGDNVVDLVMGGEMLKEGKVGWWMELVVRRELSSPRAVVRHDSRLSAFALRTETIDGTGRTGLEPLIVLESCRATRKTHIKAAFSSPQPDRRSHGEHHRTSSDQTPK